MLTAINPKYQAKINRAIKWNAKYDQEVNAMDLCETDKEIAKSERLQEKHYDKLMDIVDGLPKREQAQLVKHFTIYI